MARGHLPGWEPLPAEVHGYWPSQQRARRGWLKPLLIGCGSALGVVVAGFIALVLAGSLLIASGHPGATGRSVSTQPAAACSPQPCATLNGVTLQVSNVDRNYVPKDLPSYLSQSQVAPQPGFHRVRLEVTFVDVSGEHEVSASNVQLVDALGYQQGGSALDFEDPACTAKNGSASMAPGGRLGPIPLCFDAGGATAGRLKLVWIPSGLTGLQPGAEIQLP